MKVNLDILIVESIIFKSHFEVYGYLEKKTIRLWFRQFGYTYSLNKILQIMFKFFLIFLSIVIYCITIVVLMMDQLHDYGSIRLCWNESCMYKTCTNKQFGIYSKATCVSEHII